MTEEESHTASSKDSTIASYIHPNAAEAGSVFPTTGLLSEENLPGKKSALLVKIANEYGHVRHIPPPVKRSKAKKPKKEKIAKSAVEEVLAEEEQIEEEDVPSVSEIMDQVLSERLWEHDLPISSQVHSNRELLVVILTIIEEKKAVVVGTDSTATWCTRQGTSCREAEADLLGYVNALGKELAVARPKPIHGPAAKEAPEYHAPWALHKVVAGHTGWVRSIAVDHTNEFFCTGAADRVIKVWDLASTKLKLTLTGHISTVRGLAISNRHPYLFSCGEDKQVKCWDLECNRVIRHYHGHLSGCFCLAIHPTLDIIFTGGRDSVVRVWDMRTKTQIHVLEGHSNTVASIDCQNDHPMVISGSMDSQVKLWDIRTASAMSTLTNHKKGVRAVKIHPNEFSFTSVAADNIKKWKLPTGQFLHNFDNKVSVTNTLSLNHDNVLVSGGDEGSLNFWDWKTGSNFCTVKPPPQPGSLESESGVFCSQFDMSGTRLITGDADKSIKIYKEVQ